MSNTMYNKLNISVSIVQLLISSRFLKMYLFISLLDIGYPELYKLSFAKAAIGYAKVIDHQMPINDHGKINSDNLTKKYPHIEYNNTYL